MAENIITVMFRGAEQYYTPTLPIAPGTLEADVLLVQRILENGVLSVADVTSGFGAKVNSIGNINQPEEDLSDNLYLAVIRMPASPVRGSF